MNSIVQKSSIKGFHCYFFLQHCSGHWENWTRKVFLIFLLGTTKGPTSGYSTCLGPAVGIWNFKICKTSNDCQACYRYPLELKPDAKFACGCAFSINIKNIRRVAHCFGQNWEKRDIWRLTGPKMKGTTWPTEPKEFKKHFPQGGCWRENLFFFFRFL